VEFELYAVMGGVKKNYRYNEARITVTAGRQEDYFEETFL